MKIWLLNAIDTLRVWVFWQCAGWPSKWRCSKCCGSGKYGSELGARYGDAPSRCDGCGGSGWRPRTVWGMLRLNCRVW